MAITLLVAIFTVHLPNGFSSIKLQSVDATGAHFGQPGYETDLLYMAGLFALVLGGPGRFALDRLLLRRFGLTEYSDVGFRNDRQDGSSEPAGSEKQPPSAQAPCTSPTLPVFTRAEVCTAGGWLPGVWACARASPAVRPPRK